MALLNPALIRLVAADAKAASQSLSMQHPEANATDMLDRFVAETGTRWEHDTMVVGDYSIELPMLRFERDVVRRWQDRAKAS